MERPEEAIDRMLRLLDLERGAEVEETGRLLQSLSGPQLEARGVSLLGLSVAEEDAGLGGRILITLERTTREPFPHSRIQPGDIVRLVGPDAAGAGKRKPLPERAPSGVVWKKTGRQITVAFDDLPEEGLAAGSLRVDRVANDITYRRMREALQKLRSIEKGRPAQLRETLLGEREPRFDPLAPLTPLDPGLNPSQVEAVRLAVAARDVALIHGPPGTGKTTTLVELIRQAVGRRERVLASAPSNIAVDNLVEGLARFGVRVVRIGHPARLLPTVVEHSLDSQVAAHPHTRIAAGLHRQVKETLKRARRERDHAARRARYNELRSLRREIASIEDGVVRAVIDGAEVVLATCAGAQDSSIAGREFDLAVIDEAAQALEPAAWIPVLPAGRVVLAGDHRQLPPTIISREAAREGLAVTLFDRLMTRAGPRLSRLLSTQYRMHRSIMEYPSRELYEGKLLAAPAVAGHLLTGLAGVEAGPATEAPLWFIDTAGCGYEEEREAEGESKENPGEAEAAALHAEALMAAGVPPSAIGVISPYGAQVRRLRERLASAGEELEIDTVDGFQGREKEALVISLVRSNPRGEVGFLSDVRRINVALTRARRHLAVFGDSATVARDPFIAGFIRHAENAGGYRSAWELGWGELGGFSH